MSSQRNNLKKRTITKIQKEKLKQNYQHENLIAKESEICSISPGVCVCVCVCGRRGRGGSRVHVTHFWVTMTFQHNNEIYYEIGVP